MRHLLPLLLLLACDGDTDETDGPPDADGDGYDVTVDCDDDDPDIFPGATEVCDGLDNDCDGEADEAAEGTRAFFEDADEDGYGTSSRRLFACFPPGGYVLDDSDCDDSDAGRHPGVPEVCDEIDNDCNGEVDDNPTDGSWWYPDDDRDGWGGDAGRVISCKPVGGHLPTGGDCDDRRPLVNPDGIEVCDDRDVDEDCDGLIDDDDDSVTELIAWFVDADADGYGDRDDPLMQCADPGGRILQGGDCRDDLPAVNPSASEICGNGIDDDCNDHALPCGVVGVFDGSLAYGVRDGQQSGGGMGMAMLGVGDRDGDGYGEILAAAPQWDKGIASNTGQIYAFEGPITGVFSITRAAFALTGVEEYARLGRSLALADDLDSDGLAEVVIGSPGGSPERVYLTAWDQGADDPLLTLQGPTARAAFGESVAWVDDVTGDGVSDLWIGGPDESSGGLRAGAAWLLSGALRGEQSADDEAAAVVYGVTAAGRCGIAVAAADLDGDGTPSLLLGCGQETVYAGLVAVFDAMPTGAVDITDADGTLDGVATRYGAGAALASIGDVNDDGYDDFVVGSPGAGGSAVGWEGAAYLWLGEVPGSSSLADADVIFEGEVAENAFGASVTGGDLDNDGVPEVIIGAPRFGGDKRGRVYVFSEPTSGSLTVDDAAATIDGEDPIDNFGGAVHVAPDTSGNGYPDLLIGAHNRDAIGEGSGAVYLFVGGPGY